MTADEFVALLDDRADRELIRGQLRERPRTFHPPAHSGTAASLAHRLKTWEEGRPRPRPVVLGQGAGYLVRRGPDTLIVADLSVASATQMVDAPRNRPYLEGPPILAVEILEAWDTRGAIPEKIEEFLEAGATVWEVDPDFQTVRVHRPGRPPESFNSTQELDGEPELPGFRVAVAAPFGD